MTDCDEGPKRRVFRGRKRPSCEGRDIPTEKRTLRSSNGKKNEDWFSSSFQSKKVADNFASSKVEKFHANELISSTPVSKRRRRHSTGDDSMNKSDKLLADLDIDALTSQASQANLVACGDSGKNNENVRCDTAGIHVDGRDKPTDNVSVLDDSHIVSSPTESQSQYFVPKFRNYKSTQQLQRKEVKLDNSLNTSICRNDTLSVSSIAGNTQSQINGRCTQTVEILEESLHDSSNRVKTSRHGAKSQSVSADPSRNVEPMDGPGEFSQSSPSTSAETVVDITQLKEDGGLKFRCTPYRHKSSDLYTQTQGGTQYKTSDTQTQGELMAGTQYKNFLYDSVRSQSQFISCDIKPTCRESSQVPSSAMYNMTGVLIDSQDNMAETGDNTSDCDLFNDSTAGDVSGTCTTVGADGEAGPCIPSKLEADVKSYTQSLICSGSGKPSQSRRSSLDDDIDSIMQESQCLRHQSRTSKHSIVPAQGKCEPPRTSKHSNVPVKSGTLHNKCELSRTSKHSSESVQSGSIMKTELGTDAVKPTGKGAGTLVAVNTPKGTDTLVAVNTPEGAGTLVAVNTPVGSGTLQDRIKKRLQENVGRKTPHRPGALMEQLRDQVLERVQLEAAIMKQQMRNDVGPFYGLPTKVKHLFENYRGIKTLYDWQDECLKLPAVQQRTNLIYSLPTSGGKTLVAEILILHELLCHKRDALLILPFVSIVQEKVRNLSQFAVDLNFYVEEYAGSKGRFPPVKRRHNRSLYIATIEKAQSIVNSLIETERMDTLGLVVVDELHMLGEGGSRGSALESTLMKILHAASPTHIIGMSATLNNIEDLRRFLNAEVYSNDFRPVTLTEYVKVSDSMYKVDSMALCPDDQFLYDRTVCFQYRPDMNKVDPDQLLGLVLEVIPDHSCLVFCPTKKNCENVALMMCKLMSKYRRELSEVKKCERKELLKELYNDSEGKMCPVLKYTVYFGVAYHHSGLTSDERKLIEEAYSNGTLCLLTCTSTLAAGVNLPAKRVILRSPFVGQCFISRSQYKQMVGRAGRAGIDDSGESVLICKSSDRDRVRTLLQGPIESCHSSLLYNAGKGLRILLLSTIGLKITPTTEDVFGFVGRSLASIQQSVLQADIIDMCKCALQNLIDIGLVVQVKTTSEDPQQSVCHSLQVTRLGQATFKGPIDSDYAVMLYEDLKKAEEPLVITTHLHLLYLVTPYDAVSTISPSWFIYFNQMSHFSSSELKVASLIGVPESYIAKRASQQKSKQKVDDFVVSRFYLTLMLYDLWREKSVWEVAEKYQQTRGFIQNLLSSAASFATCVSHFCAELEEFWAYQDLMGNFVKRLSYCVNAELIPLMEIPGVKLGRARLLHAAGYQTLSAVASSNPTDLVKNVQYMPGKIAKQIVASAKLMLIEKAEAMMEEVEALVSVPEDQRGRVTLTKDTTPVSLTPALSQTDIT